MKELDHTIVHDIATSKRIAKKVLVFMIVRIGGERGDAIAAS